MKSADTDGATSAAVESPEVPVDGEWVHLTGVYDAQAREIRLYLFGKLQAKTGFTSSWWAGGPLTVGNLMQQGGAAQPWNGDVDNVLVYAGVPSAAQIATDAAS